MEKNAKPGPLTMEIEIETRNIADIDTGKLEKTMQLIDWTIKTIRNCIRRFFPEPIIR
jgi:hypothetical protein